MIALQVMILVCLGVICYQDMRYRAVYWVCFPILSLLFLALKSINLNITDTLVDAGYAFLFFGMQLFLLWAYFALKNGKPVHMTKHYLGLGDVLFLLAITFYLSPLNYVVFYIGSLIVVLIYTLTKQNLFKKVNLQIPLAGLQALMLGLILIVSIVHPNLKLYSDFWIYRF